MHVRLPFAIPMAAVTFASWVLLPHPTVAHNIPNDVTVQAFFRPEGRHLRLLVRVPLKAMRDVEFTQRGPGYLDLDRIDSVLPDAVNLWISGAIDIYEDGTRLPKPSVLESRVSLESDRPSRHMMPHWHICWARDSRMPLTWSGTKCYSTLSWTTRSNPIELAFRSTPNWLGWG